MPELTRCPECGKKLKVPDNLIGKQVKCPGCGKPFVASVLSAEPPPAPPRGRSEEGIGEAPRPRRPAPMPAPSEPDEDAPRDDDRGDDDYRGGGEKAAWTKVVMGTNFQLISWAVFLCAWLEAFLGGLILQSMLQSAMTSAMTGTGSSNMTSFTTTAYAVSGCFQLLFIGSIALVVLAYVFYSSIPQRTGARGLATATLGLAGGAGAAYLLYLLASFLLPTAAMGAAGSGMAGLQMLAGAGIGILLLSILFFLLSFGSLITCAMLWKIVAAKLKAGGLVSNCNALVITGGALAAFSLILLLGIFVFGAAVMGMGPTTGPVMGPGGRLNPTVANQANTAASLAWLWCGCVGIDGLLLLGYGVWFIVTIFLFRGEVNNYLRTL